MINKLSINTITELTKDNIENPLIYKGTSQKLDVDTLRLQDIDDKMACIIQINEKFNLNLDLDSINNPPEIILLLNAIYDLMVQNTEFYIVNLLFNYISRNLNSISSSYDNGRKLKNITRNFGDSHIVEEYKVIFNNISPIVDDVMTMNFDIFAITELTCIKLEHAKVIQEKMGNSEPILSYFRTIMSNNNIRAKLMSSLKLKFYIA